MQLNVIYFLFRTKNYLSENGYSDVRGREMHQVEMLAQRPVIPCLILSYQKVLRTLPLQQETNQDETNQDDEKLEILSSQVEQTLPESDLQNLVSIHCRINHEKHTANSLDNCIHTYAHRCQISLVRSL